jgi:hypothetical protein
MMQSDGSGAMEFAQVRILVIMPVGAVLCAQTTRLTGSPSYSHQLYF